MKRNGQANLEGLQVFAAVAEAGGFTAAAEKLGTTKANVSVQIGRLETQLGVSLFTRTTRRVRLTEAGRALYADSAPALQALREALAQASSGEVALSGTLRLTGAIDHCIQSLAPAVARFGALHPALQLELLTSDRVVDLVAEGVDLAIRLGTLRDSSLRAIKLGEFEQWVVASPAYLDRAGIPAQPEALSQHDWAALTLLKTPLTWTFSRPGEDDVSVRMKSRLRADSSASLRALLLAGAGISTLDHLGVERDVQAGRLVRLLTDWTLPKGGVYAVFPPGRHVPAHVRAFIDFYRDYLGQKA